MNTAIPIANENEESTPEGGLSYRQAPHNLEAEQALLGAILVNNEACQRVSGFLLPEHFFEDVHGRIYEAIVKLVNDNRTADPVKLKPYFEGDEALEDVGGASISCASRRALRRSLMPRITAARSMIWRCVES